LRTNNVNNFALAAHSQSSVLMTIVVTPHRTLLGIVVISSSYKQ